MLLSLNKDVLREIHAVCLKSYFLNKIALPPETYNFVVTAFLTQNVRLI